jgi:hypothetical protein
VPWPPRQEDVSDPISGVELVMMGVQFAKAASTVTHERLQQDFTTAGAQLIETGLSQL